MTSENPIQKNEQHPHVDKKYVTNVEKTMRRIDSGPSVHHQVSSKKIRQVPVDIVEEEGMESFPASDPPSHHHSHADKPEPHRPGQPD